MSDSAKPQAARRTGPPGLSASQQAKVLGELLMLEKRSPEYRAKRRELAVEMQRTEQAIENLFDKLVAARAPKHPG